MKTTNKIKSLINCKTCQSEMAYSANNCPKCGGANDWIHPKIEEFLRQSCSIDEIPACSWYYNKTWIEIKSDKRRHADASLLFLRLLGTLLILVLWELCAGFLRLFAGGVFALAAGEVILIGISAYYLGYCCIALIRQIFTSPEKELDDWENFDMFRIDYTENLNEPEFTSNNDKLWEPLYRFFMN